MTKFGWTNCPQCYTATDTLFWDGRKFSCYGCDKRVEPDVTLAEARKEAQKELVDYMTQNQELKADGGKLNPGLLIEGMPRAIMAVTAVLSYGAQKYAAHSWKKVEMERYRSAKYRHLLEPLAGLGEKDKESGLDHEAHEACNALFLLEDKLSKLTEEQFLEALKFNPPPQDHKK